MRALNNRLSSSTTTIAITTTATIFRRVDNKRDFFSLFLLFLWLALLDGTSAWEPMMTSIHRLMEVDERLGLRGAGNGSAGEEFSQKMSGDHILSPKVPRRSSSGGRSPLPEANAASPRSKQPLSALLTSSRTWRSRTRDSTVIPSRIVSEKTDTRGQRQHLPLSVLGRTLDNNLPKISHLLLPSHNANRPAAALAHTYRHLQNGLLNRRRHRHHHHHHHRRRRRRRSRRGVGRYHVDAPLPPISCFSCASAEYEALYAKANNLFTFGQPLQFDRSCDARADLHNFAPAIRCDSTCITVLEPQFFGGLLNEKRPYSYVRGCATDIFAVADAALLAATSSISSELADYENLPLPPPEIDILRRSETCVRMPINRLWPELFIGSATAVALGESGAEMVKVCSCQQSTCNTLDAADSGAAALLTRASVRIVHTSLLSASSFFLHRLAVGRGYILQ